MDYTLIWNVTYPYVKKTVIAILSLIIGFWAVKVLVNFSDKAMKKSKVEHSLRSFLKSLLSISLKILLIVTIATTIGIQMTSFVAVLAAAGFAFGLALQGSLGNLAGGILILIFKPFKVGEVIEAQGFTGTVEEIQIFNTILKSFDNKTIILPNGDLSNGSIINHTKEKTRRIDFDFGIDYHDDLEKAKKVFEDIAKADKRILKNPPILVKVVGLRDSDVNIAFKVWCKTEDYWDIYFDMFEKVKLGFDNAGISIPYPQMEITMKKE